MPVLCVLGAAGRRARQIPLSPIVSASSSATLALALCRLAGTTSCAGWSIPWAARARQHRALRRPEMPSTGHARVGCSAAVFMPHIASSSVQQIHAQMHACTHTHSRMHARADGLAPRNACAAASAQSYYSSPIPKPQPPNPQVLKQLVPCTERILAVGSDLRDWQLGASMQYPCRHFPFAPLRSHPCRFTTLPVPLDTRQYPCRQYDNLSLSLPGKHAALESALQTGADPNQVGAAEPAAAPTRTHNMQINLRSRDSS